jgi:hypothetical protein
MLFNIDNKKYDIETQFLEKNAACFFMICSGKTCFLPFLPTNKQNRYLDDSSERQKLTNCWYISQF